MKLYSHQLSADIHKPKASQALYDFTRDLNKVELMMADSTIRKAALTSLRSNPSKQKAFKWLTGTAGVPVAINQLARYLFMHSGKMIPEKRFEIMGYVWQ